MRYIIALIILINICVSQTVYEIPFSSKGNVIELSVANNSMLKVEGVKVEVTEIPEGIRFEEKVIMLTEIKSKEEQVAIFTFSVDKTVAINKEQTLSFAITDQTGQQWRKEIKVKITAPMTFELYQNYPNPFNPVTTISYQLPGEGRGYVVSLVVYDVLGREVIAIKDKEQTAGYYEERIDGTRLSSGVYIYRLYAKSTDGGKVFTSTRKMVVMK